MLQPESSDSGAGGTASDATFGSSAGSCLVAGGVFTGATGGGFGEAAPVGVTARIPCAGESDRIAPAKPVFAPGTGGFGGLGAPLGCVALNGDGVGRGANVGLFVGAGVVAGARGATGAARLAAAFCVAGVPVAGVIDRGGGRCAGIDVRVVGTGLPGAAGGRGVDAPGVAGGGGTAGNVAAGLGVAGFVSTSGLRSTGFATTGGTAVVGVGSRAAGRAGGAGSEGAIGCSETGTLESGAGLPTDGGAEEGCGSLGKIESEPPSSEGGALGVRPGGCGV